MARGAVRTLGLAAASLVRLLLADGDTGRHVLLRFPAANCEADDHVDAERDREAEGRDGTDDEAGQDGVLGVVDVVDAGEEARGGRDDHREDKPASLRKVHSFPPLGKSRVFVRGQGGVNPPFVYVFKYQS